MAAKYYKKNNELYQKIHGMKETKVMIIPEQGIYQTFSIMHQRLEPQVEFGAKRSTAREFQEAYLRAKTALDEIVSAE